MTRTAFLWQGSFAGGGRGFRIFRRALARWLPMLRPVAFNLTDFGAVGDGATMNTRAFEKAVAAIAMLGRKGGGQLNVPGGVWLTASFNLTSHMTLFLAEDAVIVGVEDERFWPMMPPFCHLMDMEGSTLEPDTEV